jgi:hypothetical protein
MEHAVVAMAPRKQAGEIAAVAVGAVRSRRELVLETVTDSSKPVAVTSVLGGLHVEYRRAA